MPSPAERALTVLDPGPLTTVQDLGRPGLAHLGVPRSGALDAVSAAAATRAVGNRASGALLEVTAGGCRLRAGRALTLAVAGAPCAVAVNGSGAPHGQVFTVRAGDVVELGPVFAGVRSYLAVAGGVDVPAVLGSRSTDLLSGLGPPPLRAGDVLAVGPVNDRFAPYSDVPLLPRLPGAGGVVLRLHPGPRAAWFTAAALESLLRATWTTTVRSNRTAVGLDGPLLARAVTDELPSEGLVLGAVQVPPAGAPLVFLADHPTTGGYPVIAVVAEPDLALLAQAPPGTPVHFVPARHGGTGPAGGPAGTPVHSPGSSPRKPEVPALPNLGRVYRFLFRPAWLALELLTAVVAVVFLLLGRWQYDSARQVAAAVAPPTAAAARPITTWIPDGTNLAAADLGRAVTLTGTFDPASQRIVPGHVRDGRTGSWVVTLLHPTPAAAAVLVARGWIPAGATAPAPPAGTVRVLGWLGGAQDPGLAAGTLLVAPLDLPAISPALLANQVSYPVSDGFVGQTAIQELSAAGRRAGSALVTVGLPAGGVTWDWQNVGYAVQWVFFAAAAVGVLGFGARRESRAIAVLAAGTAGRSEVTL